VVRHWNKSYMSHMAAKHTFGREAVAVYL